jgi:hypothetical protein
MEGIAAEEYRYIVVSPETREQVRRRIDGCLRVLEIFEWIINSFVLGTYGIQYSNYRYR